MSKYKEIYRSAERRRLFPLDRAQILLVVEGVKTGATAGINGISREEAEALLTRLGLAYRISTGAWGPVLDVSRDPRRLGEARKSFARQGRFYGYTSCSIKTYLRGKTKAFYVQLLDALKSGKGYPDEFNYLMPSQTPCSLECKNCRPLLRTWREVLLANDPEAAAALREFNRREFADVKNIEKMVRGFEKYERRAC